MFEILNKMVKEEWRMHSTMFGNLMFALFPVLLFAFAFAGSFFLPVFRTMITSGQIVLIAHYVFVLFGMSIGGFGLFGREAMNRRFGQASLIAYSSRTLPVSERKIFLNFFVKDVIYYILMWILPFMAGLGFAVPFLSIGLISYFLVFLTLTLSFLIGLSIVFFLSTLYAHSSKGMIAILVLVAVAGVLGAGYLRVELLNYLPSLSFFLSPSFEWFAYSLILIIVPSGLSLFFIKVDYPERKRKFKNSLDSLSERFSFFRSSHFIAKDLLDLHRSEGGLGKIIFSFLFPVVLIWVILFVFLELIPLANFLLMFSILLGAVASSIYDWLTEFDLFGSYLFLPVKVSSLLKSKLRLYVIMNLVPLVILILAGFLTGGTGYLVFALVTFLSVSAYTVSVKIYLGGLYPNLLFYNAKIFLTFLVAIAPILLAGIFSSIINPFYLLATPVLIVISFFIVRRSCSKWDGTEQPGF